MNEQGPMTADREQTRRWLASILLRRGDRVMPRFARLYATVKRAELDEFNSWVTPLECAWYLGPL